MGGGEERRFGTCLYTVQRRAGDFLPVCESGGSGARADSIGSLPVLGRQLCVCNGDRGNLFYPEYSRER